MLKIGILVVLIALAIGFLFSMACTVLADADFKNKKIRVLFEVIADVNFVVSLIACVIVIMMIV